MGGRGLEHPAITPPRTPISTDVRTESGTPGAQNTPSDPDLTFIQKRWAGLPEPVKAAVLALVRSVPGKELSA